jgi:hypothetical protein
MTGLLGLIVVLLLSAGLRHQRWERRSAEVEISRATREWIDYLLADCPSLTR